MTKGGGTTACAFSGNAAAPGWGSWLKHFKSGWGARLQFFGAIRGQPGRGDAYLLSQGCGLGVQLAIVAQRLELALKQREALRVHGGVRRDARRTLDGKASPVRMCWRTTRTSERVSDNNGQRS